MSLLVCDFGHSRLKIHHYASDLTQRWILPLKPFSWPEDISPNLAQELLFVGTNQPHRLRAASHLSQLGFPVAVQLGVDCKVPLLLAEGVFSVGNDRLAQALGASQEKPNARNLIVSAGSALVLDRADHGQFCGGLIGMGWKVYRETMANLNPLLVTTSPSTTHYPGRNTSEAVALGWLESAKGMIERCGVDSENIFITGGDAKMLLDFFPTALHRPWLGVDAMAKALGYGVSDNQNVDDRTGF